MTLVYTAQVTVKGHGRSANFAMQEATSPVTELYYNYNQRNTSDVALTFSGVINVPVDISAHGR